MTPLTPQVRNPKPLIALGLIISLISLMLETNRVEALIISSFSFVNGNSKTMRHFQESCKTDIVETAKLSRKQLLALLAIPERENKARIQEIVKEPYCQLSAINVRAGVEAQREAYPLAFDPNVALVILYENDEYAGYRFKY